MHTLIPSTVRENIAGTSCGDNAGEQREDYGEVEPLNPCFQFTRNLSPGEVHARALSARKRWSEAETTLIAWLIEIDDRRLYHHFSCSSIYHYASRYLKLAGHTVAEFLRTGRKLADLPLLSSAYEKGEISSTHIREITRVAVPETEGFWYEMAKHCTTRQIEKLVAFTPKGGLPPRDRTGQAEPSRTQLSEAEKNTCSRISPERECTIANSDETCIQRDVSGSSSDLSPSPGHSPGHSPNGLSQDPNPSPGPNGHGPGFSLSFNNPNPVHTDPSPCRTTADAAMTSCERCFEAQARYHEKLVVELTAEEMAIIKDAFQKARKECGKRDRRSLLLHMARAFLRGSSPDAETKKSTKPPYQVLIHHHFPSGLSWCETEKGERPILPKTLTKALCDAEIREEGDNSGFEMFSRLRGKRPLRDTLSTPRFQGEELVLQASKREPVHQGEAEHMRSDPSEDQAEEVAVVNELYRRIKMAKPGDISGVTRTPRRARRSIPRRVRNYVLDRDGHCCKAPGCGSEHFIAVHHLDPVALGGTDDPQKLITLCWNCHDLVHEGKLTVRGDAPGDLVWGGGILPLHQTG